MPCPSSIPSEGFVDAPRPPKPPMPTRRNDQRLCLRFQHAAALQCRSVAKQVLIDSLQDGQQVRMQPVDLVLSPPLPLDEAAIQQTRKVVRHAALFDSQLLYHFSHVMGLV